MKRITSLIKRTLVASTLMLFAAMPLSTAVSFADTECTPPSSETPGVHWPTGSDSGTFTYQCEGDYAGKWTNPYYVYDPASQQRTALFDLDYQVNCTTGVWSVLQWFYNPGNASYYTARVQVGNPGYESGCPVAATGGSGEGSGPSQAVSNTGPGSNNSANSNTTINGTNTNNTNVLMSNGLNSQATTGNAGVFYNTTGGSAATGDATSAANVANMLQTSSNVFGPDTLVFTADINGDVNGDFMFDPSAMISNTGPNSNNSANNNLTVNTNNTNNTNAQINNNIDVGATSGTATVSGNTNGGDATSGNAHAIVNLMNFINSTITSGKSFVGTVNINGNLNGDILLPPELINQLLASTGPGSNNSANSNVTNNSTETNNTTENINNNVTSTAQTGAANVANNTGAGSATSGTAHTGVTMLNMTGSNIVGKNNLLVFVNVLGKWVGMIVNAPAGSNAASLAGGVTNSGPNSNNTTNNNVTTNTNTTNNNNLGINNNVNVHANSGDANVTNNTSGGNAKTGNADTAVNILNVAGTNINVSDWFGVLFINVFGNWNGSFGVDTAAGNPVIPETGVPATFQFIPNPAVAAAVAGNFTGSSTTTEESSASGNSSDGVVLAAKAVKGAADSSSDSLSPIQEATNKLILPAIGAVLAFVILLAGERNRIFRRN